MSTLIHGNCIDALKRIETNSVDLICTDPPYGIAFMGKDWDDPGKMAGQLARGQETHGAFAYGGAHSRGFKDVDTDKYVQWASAWMAECLRALKPGGFAFIMQTPRQDMLSRTLAALEGAGFETGFTSIYWTYSSGFPKSMNVGKAIDRRLGGKRKVVAYAMGVRAKNRADRAHGIGAHRVGVAQEPVRIAVTAPATAKAKALDGAYGGFQPKPAVEVIVVAMKPLAERSYVDQALANGKGVTWLDACRLPGEAAAVPGKRAEHVRSGRVPANLLVSDKVLGDYSRYFSLDAWAVRHPFLIVPKASKRERNWGLAHRADRLLARSGGAQLALRRGQRSYLTQHFNRIVTVKNSHPTVKPLALMAYLVTLGSRPGDLVLDPFAGSGTTGMAARLLGRRFLGIEREREYIGIARARLAAAERAMRR